MNNILAFFIDELWNFIVDKYSYEGLYNKLSYRGGCIDCYGVLDIGETYDMLIANISSLYCINCNELLFCFIRPRKNIWKDINNKLNAEIIIQMGVCLKRLSEYHSSNKYHFYISNCDMEFCFKELCRIVEFDIEFPITLVI